MKLRKNKPLTGLTVFRKCCRIAYITHKNVRDEVGGTGGLVAKMAQGRQGATQETRERAGITLVDNEGLF